MKKLILIFATLFLACGTSEQQSTDSNSLSDNETQNENSNEIPHYTITAIDTIGVELGDSNYVFAKTDAALFAPNGEILVLDGSKKQISLFSADGEFIRAIGRQGSGPGEFQRPMALAILGNGQLAVSDPWAGKIVLFDSTYIFSGEITEFFPAPPLAIKGADGQAIIGLMKKFDIENDLIGYSLVRLDGNSEPTTIYAEEMTDLEPTMIGPGYTETTVAFASDPLGRVFSSTMSTDNYLIQGFQADGELFLEIQLPFEPVPKTPEEIEEEIADFNAFLENRASSGGGGGRMQSAGIQIPADQLNYEPNPNHYAISSLMVDPEERIWAERGYGTVPYFSVFNLDGELLFTASVEESSYNSSDLEIVVGENNLLGFSEDPLDYPKVVIFTLE